MSTRNCTTFLEALMAHVLDQVNIPKVQVERIIGPVLGMFIAEIVSGILRGDVRLISPEFPLRKVGPRGEKLNQSTNIDWLLYSCGQDQLVFVELKTTDTTYDPIQHRIYRRVIEEIREHGSSFLVSDVEAIMARSRESGKYAEVLRRANSDERHAKCRKAKLVYLAPESLIRPNDDNGVEWVSFRELPDLDNSRFAEEWKIIRGHLFQLDGQTRRLRNQSVIGIQTTASQPPIGRITLVASP